MAIDLKLRESFPPTTYEDWRETAEKQLKGAPFEKVLVKKTYEGIDIAPIYFAEDAAGLSHVDAMPGALPYVRGTRTLGHVDTPWKISQELPLGDPAGFNRAAVSALQWGQTELNIPLDAAAKAGKNPEEASPGEVAAGGLSLSTMEDAKTALSGIDLEKTPVFVWAGGAGIPVAALLAAARAETEEGGALSGTIFVDPLGELAAAGRLPMPLETAFRDMAGLTAWAVEHAPLLRTVGVSGLPYREGGASAVEELAFTAAAAVAYLRAVVGDGVSVDQACRKVAFCLGAGPDFFMEIAKFRAARLIWEAVVDAFGGDDESKKLYLHVRTLRWNKTRTDAYVNMLRVTTETFSGICGGCDGLSVGPFDEVIGETDDFSRRIARNVQIILRDECQFHRVIDPAGGSWYVERLTRELAEKAWTLFQEVERRGGMPAALEAGFVQQKTAEVAQARVNNLSTRKDVLVGTNKYPNLDEKPVAKDAADPVVIQKERADAVRRFRGSVDDASAQAALEGLQAHASGIEVMLRAITCARAGATIGEMARVLWTGDPATIDPVHIHRGGEIFERIRSRTEEFAKRTGNPAKIFLANMGPIPQHKPRADFTTGFFQVGGFQVMGNDGFDTIEAAVEAAADSGAKAVVICSTDDAYPDIVPALTKQLKTKDPDIMVILAGYPKARVDAFREAGIDLFIHIRANLPEVLETVQKHVGVT